MTDLSDERIKDVLTRSRTIAVVGISDKPERASHEVALFLQRRGYRIVPVNPGLAGRTLLGETVRATLSDIPEADGPVDMVDIFRRSEHAGAVVDEALAALKARGLRPCLDAARRDRRGSSGAGARGGHRRGHGSLPEDGDPAPRDRGTGTALKPGQPVVAPRGCPQRAYPGFGVRPAARWRRISSVARATSA